LDQSRLKHTVEQAIASQPVGGEQILAWSYGVDNNVRNLFKKNRVLVVVTNRRFVVLHPNAPEAYSIKSIESFSFNDVKILKRKKPSGFQTRFFAVLSTPTYQYNFTYNAGPPFANLNTVLDSLEDMQTSAAQAPPQGA
jgi:hypothetical protein